MHRTILSPARRWALTLAISRGRPRGRGLQRDDDGDGGTGPDQPRAYNQIQRLGNPLVSEVLLSKRSHPTHGSIGPEDDVATHRRGGSRVPHRARAAWPDARPSTPTPWVACSCRTC